LGKDEKDNTTGHPVKLGREQEHTRKGYYKNGEAGRIQRDSKNAKITPKKKGGGGRVATGRGREERGR